MKTTSAFVVIPLLLSGALCWGAQGSSLPELESQLLENNPQLRSLESKVDAQKAMSKAQIGPFLPELSITGGYEENKTIIEPTEGYLGYINARWNLFRGGEDYYGKVISSRELSVAQLDLEIRSRQLRRQLQELYFSRLANIKNLTLLSEKEEVLNLQRQMAKKKINAGLTSSVDGVEIELEENSILGEKETLKAEVVRLNKELSALIDSEVSENSGANDHFTSDAFTVDIEHAFENNPSVKRYSEFVQIEQDKISKQRAEFLPTISLDGAYGRITPQYADPLKGTESKVAVLLSWNFFSGVSSYYKHQAAEFEAKAQSLEKKSTQIDLRKEIQNLVTNRDNLLRLKSLQEKRFALAQKYYEVTLSEYKRGIKNSPDLQSATASLFESKRRMIELDRDLSITNAKIKELI